jgi:hypothetical protein
MSTSARTHERPADRSGSSALRSACAFLGGVPVVDTTRPLLVWEKPYHPTYYFPLDDVRSELLEWDEGPVVHSPSRGHARGIQVLIPPDSGLRQSARPGWDGGLYGFMRRVLSTDHAKALYRRRREKVESVFGQMKFNRGFKRFLRRGRSACRSEWRLFNASHNLLKLHRHRTLAAAA